MTDTVEIHIINVHSLYGHKHLGLEYFANGLDS